MPLSPHSAPALLNTHAPSVRSNKQPQQQGMHSPDAHQQPVHAVIGALGDQLCKDDRPLRGG